MNAADMAVIAKGTENLMKYGQHGNGPRTESPNEAGVTTESEDVVITFGSTAVALRNDDGPFLEFINLCSGEVFTLESTYPIKALLEHMEN
jgi:hypothetical protein